MLRLYFGRIDIKLPVFNYFIVVWNILLNIFFTPSEICFHSGYVNIGRWVKSYPFDMLLTRESKFVHFMFECKLINSFSAGSLIIEVDADNVSMSLLLLLL